MKLNRTIQGDALEVLKSLPDELVNCVVTSPPYWGLRDYGIEPSSWPATKLTLLTGIPPIEIPEMKCCLGLEPDPYSFIAHLVQVFDQVKRVLKKDGTLWLNIGDTYAGSGRRNYNGFENSLQYSNKGSLQRPVKQSAYLKPKDLAGIPWMLSFALRSAGWYLRSEIIWHKKQAMPESVKDRPTRNHEQIFLLSRSRKYYYDADAIKTIASPDTHARYARGRSANHKHVNGADGQVSHTMHQPKRNIPSGWDTENRSHGSIHQDGSNKVKSPKYQQAGSGVKSNNSFENATADYVSKVNKRTIWTVGAEPLSELHFAHYPQKLIEPCIKAGCPKGGIVLDPFHGSGTTGIVSNKLGRNYLAIDIKGEYMEIEDRRRHKELGVFKNESFNQ